MLECKVQERTNKLWDVQEQSGCESYECKWVKAELKKSLDLLNATLESTTNGIVAVSSQGELLSFNQKFVEMWEIPERVIMSSHGDQSQVFFKSQLKDPETFNRVLWEVKSQSEVEDYYTLELKDGRSFAHYSKGLRLREKIIGRVWNIWDVTESQRTQKALQQSEATFRTLAETTDAIIFIIQGTQFCYVNPAAEAITGYKQEELLAVPDFRQQLQLKQGKRVNKQGELAFPQYQEIKMLTKSGEQRWLDCSVRVFEFAQKPALLVTATNITKRKQAEVEILQTLEKEKELSKQRARFICMVAHEFRTSLNLISFSASLLRRHSQGLAKHKKLPYLDYIQTAVGQLNQWLDEVWLVTKVEAGQLKFEPKPLDLALLCRNLAAQMQLIGNSSQHIITCVIQGNCSAVRVDKKLVQPILTNLLSNAIKYSPPGSTVTLELCCQEQDVIFQIKDTGIGIPAAEQQQLFDLFYRGSNVGDVTGNGMGLAIVKKLVDIHSGQISMASEVGVGTTFTITLPLSS